MQENRNYAILSDSMKDVLEEFRAEVYETHGMIDPQLNILVNMFYHLMWEITLAINPTDPAWDEFDEVKAKHEQLVKLLDYQRPREEDEQLS